MGKHFVPQFYLRAFQDSAKPGFIWTWVRGNQAPDRLPIVSVAQSPDFYDPDTERELAELVEKPANPIFRKLWAREQLQADERLAFSIYLATMMYRVPKARERSIASVPSVLESTMQTIRDEVSALVDSGQITAERHAAIQTQLAEAHARIAANPVPVVRDQIRDPRPSQKVVEAIMQMTWRIITAPIGEMFLTSDNPVFYHGAFGIGRPESELRFPISPSLALHATRQPNPRGPLTYEPAPKEWVREFNRSVASGAHRLVFTHRKTSWVGKLLHRSNPYLFRLRWT